MNFYIKIFIIAIFSFTGFSVSVQAENENNYLSITDFSIHKVTPEKLNTAVINKKNLIKKEPPKLRITEQSTPKPSADSINVNKPKIQTVILKKAQTNLTTSKLKKKEIQNIKNNNNYSTAKKISESPEELVLKVNQINEKKQPIAENNFGKTNPVKDAGNDFLKLFSSLSIVLFLIFIFAWVYARLKGINPTAILTGKFSEKNLNSFNVLSTSTLGQGKDIHLVEINGKQLVIGSTASTINLLTEIPAEEIEKLKEQRQKTQNEEMPESEIIQEKDDDFYYKYLEDGDFLDSDFLLSKYSEVYKEYLDNKEKQKDSKNK